ncbi:NRAMP family divalent metal transporter [Curtobacterium ammoniigenes]|uniref:NRAMP family divalent metal transporter n=1 Tax=Curtobacterium ammoniigenes TaxID=395387 RepID=UPI000830B80F|nr:divalent metal cation transporter [Curtobacterium ammoniigenes]
MLLNERGTTAPPTPTRRSLLAVWGPGLIVMLADTDAGCLITAAQSGAQWGYAMVLPQLVLIPILFMVQEITVRLGVVTRKGHGQLIREHFGGRWAWVSAGTLVVSAVGALLTEFAGIAGVGELFGVSRWITVPIVTLVLVVVALLGSYRRVERIGIIVGLGQLAFIPAMIAAHPRWSDLSAHFAALPLANHGYLYLLAANVGAVIMPWMIFYQQTAVIDKGITIRDLGRERRDTAFGSLLTQGVMIVVIITLAATIWRTGHGGSTGLGTVGQIATALAPFLGNASARVLIGVAILGGAFVAAIVVSLAGSWGIADVLGWKHSLNGGITRSNRPFFLVYALTHVVGAVIVLASADLVQLAVDVEVMNALLLPIVLGLLLLLERRALPPAMRMRGIYRWSVTGLSIIVIGFSLYTVPTALGLVH